MSNAGQSAARKSGKRGVLDQNSAHYLSRTADASSNRAETGKWNDKISTGKR
jgi:hypothetical protein